MTGELEQFKEQVTRLATEAFPSDVPGAQLADSLIARLCEETGEVAREDAALLKFQQRLAQSGPAK